MDWIKVTTETMDDVMDCSKCIHCEDIDYLNFDTVICAKGRITSIRAGCDDFSPGINERRYDWECVFRLERYISPLNDDDRKQIYQEIEDFCERHIIPEKYTVLGRWIEGERRRACGESSEKRPV